MALENLTTYVEVDAGGDITVTSPKCDVVTMATRFVQSYVYKDFGIDHFEDVEDDFEIYISPSDTGSSCSFWSYCNEINTMGYFWANSKKGFICRCYIANGAARLYLNNFVPNTQDWGGISLSTLYYLTGKRIDTAISVKIYTDSGRTNLHDTIAITGVNDPFRYFYVCQPEKDSNPTPEYTAYSQNYELGVPAPPPPEHIMTPQKYW